jgi:hypothetical protein
MVKKLCKMLGDKDEFDLNGLSMQKGDLVMSRMIAIKEMIPNKLRIVLSPPNGWCGYHPQFSYHHLAVCHSKTDITSVKVL